jgi:hypothetical protein
MLAVVECMKHWHPQLSGTRFEVLTDHAPLRFWKTQRDLSKRQIRWLDFLCDFDFDIKYIPGVVNTAADALSRYPYANTSIELNLMSATEIDPLITQRIKDGYVVDAFFAPIIEHPEQFSLYTLQNGLLFYGQRLCIPRCKTTREMLLHQYHDRENHFGITKTRQKLATEFFWPYLSRDVRKYINSCPTCLRNKSSNQAPAGFLHSLPIPADRFSEIAIDFVGPLPKSQGFDAIVVFTDRLTNYVKIEPTYTTATAEDTARLAYRSWSRQFGLPRELVSDRDKLFTSKFWRELHRLLNVDIKLSTAFHPETDGSSERSNKTVIEALRAYANRRGTDWTSHLIQVELSMNNSVNATTHQTPTEMLYGTSIRLFPRLQTPIDTPVPAVADFIERINESIAIAKDNHLTAKTIQTQQANKSRRPEPEYKVGDRVMLDSRNIRRRLKAKNRSAKFFDRFLGPFKITEAKPEISNYTLELVPAVDFESIHPSFHAKLLRPFVPNDPEQFPSREPPRPPPLIPEDDQWEVEAILDERTRYRRKEYLVHWKGYPDEDNMWVKASDVSADLIAEYRNSITT